MNECEKVVTESEYLPKIFLVTKNLHQKDYFISASLILNVYSSLHLNTALKIFYQYGKICND